MSPVFWILIGHYLQVLFESVFGVKVLAQLLCGCAVLSDLCFERIDVFEVFFCADEI